MPLTGVNLLYLKLSLVGLTLFSYKKQKIQSQKRNTHSLNEIIGASRHLAILWNQKRVQITEVSSSTNWIHVLVSLFFINFELSNIDAPNSIVGGKYHGMLFQLYQHFTITKVLTLVIRFCHWCQKGSLHLALDAFQVSMWYLT